MAICKEDEKGIRDVLGYYNSESRAIHLCEEEIFRHAKILGNRLSKDLGTIYPILLVYMNTFTLTFTQAKLQLEQKDLDEWFKLTSNEVHKPLAKLLSYIIIQKSCDITSLPMKIFEEIESTSSIPIYYLYGVKRVLPKISEIFNHEIVTSSIIPLIPLNNTSRKKRSMEKMGRI